jgi:type III pantothenate kinase
MDPSGSFLPDGLLHKRLMKPGGLQMLLAIDVGNTTISVGLMSDNKELKFYGSLDTDIRKTDDRISMDLVNLFSLYGYSFSDVTGVIMCSVVPSINLMMEKALTRILGKPPMIVGPGVKTGLKMRLTYQAQAGGDIVANAVAALEKFHPPIITIDMGTATAIGVITENRVYEGGLLFPGVQVSLEALSQRAALLPDIALQQPKALIGKSTEEYMRSGIVYGNAGMLDGIIDRIREEFPGKEVSICGELAANCMALPLLLGAGLRKLSMNSTAIGDVRNYIRSLSMDECRRIYLEACNCDTHQDVRLLIEAEYQKHQAAYNRKRR